MRAENELGLFEMYLFNKIKNVFDKMTVPAAVISLLCLLISHPALAEEGEAAGNTLGSVISNTIESSSDIPGLLSGLSYLFGIVLGFMAIMKLKDHVESPNQTPIWDPLKRFLAGGAFLALPSMVSAVVRTVSKDMEGIKGDGYNTGGATTTGLDGKLVALIEDIWDPLQALFIGFGYVAGIILVLIGISRLLKTEQEGARGPMGLGTIVTFIVAGILLSLNKILGATVGSIFGGDVTSNAGLAYTAGMDGEALAHANAVIGAVLAFVAIIGWISFIRGFFIMRGVAEGNSQASAMAGFTHIIGGALAVNLGGFIQAVQTTLGIEKFGLEFASIVAPYMTSVTFIA